MGTTTPQQRTGRDAEDEALRHLQSAGLELVAKNYRCRWGEIDLIVRDRQCLVFVEVRYRRNRRFGGAAESVDGRKQHKVIRTAQTFLSQNPKWSDYPARFDIVAIEELRAVEWIRNAFET